MEIFERKITASRDHKTLYIRVNNQKISVPWTQSRFYIGEQVRVSIEKNKEEVIYSVRPVDDRLPWNETHWIKEENNGAATEGVSGKVG